MRTYKAEPRCAIITNDQIEYDIQVTNLNSRLTTVTQLPDMDAPFPECIEDKFLFEFEASQELVDLIEMLRFTTSLERDDCLDEITRIIMSEIRKRRIIISQVMSELGKRKKTMTPAAIEARRNAAKKSAAARRERRINESSNIQ